MRELTKEETDAIALVLSRFVWDSSENEDQVLEKLTDEDQRNRVRHELKWLRGFAVDFAGGQSKVGKAELAVIFKAYHDHWEQWGETDADHRGWVSNLTAVQGKYSETAEREDFDGLPLAIGKTFAELCREEDQADAGENEAELAMYGAIEFAATVKHAVECLDDAMETILQT